MKDQFSSPGEYIYNLIRWLDIGLNTLLAGNDRQTLSSRLYEAAVLEHIWYWHLFYWLVNTIAFPIGILFGQHPPLNHCKDAFLSYPDLRTYS